ncbi:MAG: HAD family hydrolase [Dongiaceae bacterium]
MPAKIRAVLFDKDGTLIDFRATWLPAYEAIVRDVFGDDDGLVDRLLEAGGYDRRAGSIDPASELVAGTNLGIASLWAELVGRLDVDRVAEQLNHGFMRHAQSSLVPVTNLPALFGRLRHRGLKIGVATNDSEMALQDQVDRLAIREYLDFCCGYDSGHGGKPEPGMVQAFGSAVGVPVNAIAVVGDSLHDLEMARSAGAGLAIGVLTGASPRELLALHCDHVLDNIDEIETILSAPN